MSFAQKLRSVDFYRKINRELTEGTLSGSIVSIATAVLIVFLLTMELSSYISIKTSTNVVVDKSSDQQLKINFNITFPHLECQFASVDVHDVLGRHKVNVTKTVSKWKVDKHLKRIGQIQELRAAPKFAELEAKDGQFALQVTSANWEQVMSDSKVVLVNFYAPWCPWSRKLTPVWEHTAELLGPLYPKDVVQLVKVDCTDHAAHSICQNQHVNAFPSIRIYRGGSDTRVTGMGHEHNAYYGDRTPEALVDYVKGLLTPDDINARSERVTESERDGEAAVGEGCTVAGFVRVSRVPGNVVVSTHSTAHSFDAANMNVSHIIHHLSFGDELEDRQIRALPEEAKNQIGLFDNQKYIGEQKGTSHEHYIKIVLNTFEKLNGEVINTYEFTANSNKYIEEKTVPMARFSYDLSPMQVVIHEYRTPFTHFITQLCAIIGGVFTVAGIIDSLIFHGAAAMSKKIL